MTDVCEMRELTDTELDGVYGGCGHHGWGHHGHGSGQLGHLRGLGQLSHLGGLVSHSFNTVTQTIVQIGIVIGGGSITQIASNVAHV
jgi:hypothetical protein